MAAWTMVLAAEILRRLPAKSVVRFRSVSKEWATFCSEPYFAKLRRKNLDGKLIQSHGRLFSLDLDSLNCALEIDSLLRDPAVDDWLLKACGLRLNYGFGLKKVLGCSNGMICLSVYKYNSNTVGKQYPLRVENIPPADLNDDIIVICDLSTCCAVFAGGGFGGYSYEEGRGGGRIYHVGQTGFQEDFGFGLRLCGGTMWRHFSYGFGFDPSSEDYKLVRISQYIFRAVTPPHYKVLMSEVKVYSMKTNSWSKVDQDVAHICINRMAEPALVGDGVLYWIAGTSTVKGSEFCREIVVAFDLADEGFLDMVYEEQGSRVMCLGSIGGKLCAMTRCRDIVKLWKIEENGDVWILLGSFSFGVNLPYPVYTTMHFSKNGDKVLVVHRRDKVCFDLAKGTWSLFRMKFITMQGMVEKDV